jgi:hypothetical protein
MNEMGSQTSGETFIVLSGEQVSYNAELQTLQGRPGCFRISSRRAVTAIQPD